MTNVSLGAAAVLVWLPTGQTPNTDSFHITLDTTEPPYPNPEPWWVAREAIVHAVELADKYGKEPWIKVAETVLSPAEVSQLYAGLNHSGGENA